MDLRSRFSGLSYDRKQSLVQLFRWNALLIAVVMNTTAPADPYLHVRRQRIYHGRTYSMQSTACLIRIIIKFTSGMQRRKYKARRRHSLFMKFHRNAPSIITNRSGTILFQHHLDLITVACQMLVY